MSEIQPAMQSQTPPAEGEGTSGVSSESNGTQSIAYPENLKLVRVRTINLDELGEAARGGLRALQESGKEVVRAVDGFSIDGIFFGMVMIRAKVLVGHGDWLKWCAEELPSTSQRTIQRWMTVAKDREKEHNPALKRIRSGEGLLEALVDSQIIPEPEKQARQIRTAAVDIYANAAQAIAKAQVRTTKLLEIANTDSWPEEKRAALREQVRPLIEAFQKL